MCFCQICVSHFAEVLFKTHAFFIVQAFGTIVQFGSATPINDALPSLAQRTCDSNPSVRLCLVSVVGSWLLDLPDRSKKEGAMPQVSGI